MLICWINSVWSKIVFNCLVVGCFCNMVIDKIIDIKYINFIKYLCSNVFCFVFVFLCYDCVVIIFNIENIGGGVFLIELC